MTSQGTDIRNQYPINTFKGTTQDELVALVESERRKAAIEERRTPKCVGCSKPLEAQYHKKCWSKAVAALSQEDNG